MVEWTIEWTMEFRKKPSFHSNTQLYYVAICLLTYSQPALPCIGLHSCNLLKVVKVMCNLISFNGCILYKPAIKETSEV